jgi:hypothetical protein
LGSTLRHPARRGDDHHHHHLRLEQQHLDVADLRRLERRRRDERDQRGHLREHLGRDPKRRIDLVSDARQVDREHLRRERLLQQRLGVEPVARVGRHPPGRRVGMIEQTLRLERGQLIADRRR